MQKQKKGLGRGLNALITPVEETASENGVLEVDINKIEPNPEQPRKTFDEESLTELANSIKQHGIIQPLIVKEEDNFYSIIAGERRWRAARIAKLKKLPVIVKDYSNSDTLEIALIENLQREDLNPIEEAQGYQKLSKEYFFSQEEIANKVGKKKSIISQYMKLLNLDDRVQNFVSERKITAAHGRSLLLVDDFEKQFQLAEQVIEDGITVKQLETVIKSYLENKDAPETVVPEKKETKPKMDSNFHSIEEDLKNILGSKVQIKNGKKKGKIEIEYYSPEELDRLIGIFKKF